MVRRTPRCLILTGVLWLCFLTKLAFYSSFVPLWEGYDEFSHFAFVQHLAGKIRLPDLQSTSTSQEIAASLRLAPVPWIIRDWTQGWITYDDFWRLPEGVRRDREGELKKIPPALALESAANLRLYEAQQPPLAYLLYWIPWILFQGADIMTRAWVLRITGAAIASLIVPFGFIAARRVFRNEWQAVGVVAVAVSMPELMMMSDHAGNEPLAMVLSTACVYALSVIGNNAPPRLLRALFLGGLLGCGLLTKAYFLAFIPAIAGVYAVLMWRNPRSRGRIAVQLLLTCGSAAVIAGWWYGRAIYTTGTLTGHELAIAARHSTTPLFVAIGRIHWGRVADFALLSHIWLGGWSFLVLRTWMYRVIEFVLIVGQVGNLRRVGNPPGPLSANLAICIALQLFFWIGLVWFAINTYLATGQAGVFGYYAYVLVIPEAACLIAGISALIPIPWTRFIVPALVICFAAAEVYSTVFCLMPYYAGLTAHTPRGSVPAMHASRLLNGGVTELFRNLAVNKPDFLSPGVLLALGVAFLLAVAGVVAVSVFLASSGQRGESGSGAAHGLVPLGSR